MRINKTSIRPGLGTILKFFLLMIIALFVIKTMMHIFFSANPFEPQSYRLWTSILLLAVGTSIGVSFGGRKHRLQISETLDSEKLLTAIVQHLQRNGLKEKNRMSDKLVLEDVVSFNRVLNNWFGTELVTVHHQGAQITIEGPVRFIDSVDSTIRNLV